MPAIASFSLLQGWSTRLVFLPLRIYATPMSGCHNLSLPLSSFDPHKYLHPSHSATKFTVITFDFHEMRGISSLAEKQLASQEGLYGVSFPLCQLKRKETVKHVHDRHNITILSITRNMSTTCYVFHRLKLTHSNSVEVEQTFGEMNDQIHVLAETKFSISSISIKCSYDQYIPVQTPAYYIMQQPPDIPSQHLLTVTLRRSELSTEQINPCN